MMHTLLAAKVDMACKRKQKLFLFRGQSTIRLPSAHDVRSLKKNTRLCAIGVMC
jgi:hypothetical protein